MGWVSRYAGKWDIFDIKFYNLNASLHLGYVCYFIVLFGVFLLLSFENGIHFFLFSHTLD